VQYVLSPDHLNFILCNSHNWKIEFHTHSRVNVSSSLVGQNYKDLGSPAVRHHFLGCLYSVLYYLLSTTFLWIFSSQYSYLYQHVLNRFLIFLLSSNKCLSSILDIVRSGPSKSLAMHFSIEINVFELMERDYVLATMLLRYPFTLMLLLEEAIIKAQRIVIRNLTSIESSRQMVTVKGERNTPTTIHARLVHLPPHINCCKASLSCIDAGDIGRIVQLSGTVVRTTPVRMVEKSRAYICLAKNCGHKFVVYADFEQSNNALNAPTNCPNIDKQWKAL